jgi:hypothetical protein
MFQHRNFNWSSHTQDRSIHSNPHVVYTWNFDRRSLFQFPIPPQIVQPTQKVAAVLMDVGTESEISVTQDEEMVDTVDSVSVEQRESITSTERRLFSTPCGQTYWVDDDLCLYTNETVEIPIGYWCDRNQCIYFDVGLDETTDDEDDDDDPPPPPPPPMYEESDSLIGTATRMDTNIDNEEDVGEVMIGASP